MRTPETKTQNRRALLLVLIGLILAALLLSLPLISFEMNVYKKKSANTFVGDEKYQAVAAEVEAVAEEYRARGHEVTMNEEVLERVNSKGEKTSLITFTLSDTSSRSLWSLLGAGLGSSKVLAAMIGCFALCGVFALLGLRGSSDLPARYLDRGTRVLRGLACAAALLALLAVPVLLMTNNYLFTRRLGLYQAELIDEGKAEFFARLGKYLGLGVEGEEVNAALAGLSYRASVLIWLLAPAAFLALLGALQIRYGEIRSALLRGLLYFFVVVVCVVTLYPYYVMTITAFRSNAETLDMYFLHMAPTRWVWSNLTDIIHRGVPRYLLNSLLVAGGATLVAMLCGIPAAYAMARMDFRGKKAFLGFVIMSQMFSPVVLLIGISQLMNTLHLNDSVVGLMLINAAFNQAFAIWLLRGTFVSISSEMEQAALIDGCGTVGALTKVLIPMAAPGIVTALIFVFINAWNEYTISTVLISTSTNRPITVGITQFSSFNMIEWQYLFAASLLATIPVVILFMSIEKHLTAGLTSGGVKG